ncbi:Metallo-dependent phosphatase [Coemansia reversa NRRL 1564]|uniref:Metallo-dependent phosphatase n=1 Tax=Coemansia reversa (strain ATCC 12441 / NRRL 1564) TaxID=763665 RepID=A0A2G5B1Y0_COERN|nr:Metallo-dependent phosphatase [Coemansia reversa NRRL 1564]|eukprot:PIA13030.1 Metallo-dependent phosphatase [Coemansia reversa NRRL 1564]
MKSFVFSLLCALVLICQKAEAKEKSLRIIHTNDIHAHYSPFNKYGGDCSDDDKTQNNCFGGAARLTTIINQLRSGHSNSLLFDAGDQAQGTLFYTLGKFNTTIKIMNHLRYDAMCLGNHEFDDGPGLLADFLNEINFPAICANIDTSRNPKLAKVVKPYVIIEKYKLGVIGYITNTTGSISQAGSTVSFTDAAAAVNKYVSVLHSQGITSIIAVSHNGYHEDMDVAANTHGLGLIVGGHSHTYLSINPSEPGSGGPYPTIVKNLDGHNTYVVQAKAWGEYVGYVDIDFDHAGVVANLSGKPIHMTQMIKEDDNMAESVREMRKPFDDYGENIVGKITSDLSHTGCKQQECELGDLVADAMLWSGRQSTNDKADIAIINGGGIRAGARKGIIKIKDILLITPFGDSLVKLHIRGKDLQAIVAGVFAKSNVANHKPVTGFLQVAGMRIKYHYIGDHSDTTADSMVVDSIEVGSNNTWSLIDNNMLYTVITLNYVAHGGDNIIADAVEAPALETLDVVIADYLRAFSPVSSPQMDRIINNS